MSAFKFVLGIFILCAGTAVLFAESFDACIVQAESWISKTYEGTPILQRYKQKQLSDILNSTQTPEEKIAAVKKAFPEAFRDKPLIYTTPLTWRIHSLALGYDIDDTATCKENVTDILEKIRNEQTTQQDTSRKVTGTSLDIKTGAGIDSQTSINIGSPDSNSENKSFNPFSWLKFSSRTQLSISGSCNFGLNISSQKSAIWSESQQRLFSEKHSVIREILQQTTVKNRHLSFTLTLTNNTSEEMRCNLKNAFIHITFKGNTLASASVKEEAYQLSIPAKGTKDIRFRAELNNTEALKLVELMRYAAPDIDISRGGLRISSSSFPDAVSSSKSTVPVSKVRFSFPRFNAEWNIRHTHTSDNSTVTLREALQAIQKDWKENNKKILTWEEERLTAISSVPFGKFADGDKEKRFLAFLKIADRFHTDIDKKLLDTHISAGDYEIIIVDLDKRDELKNVSQALQSATFETVRNCAEQNPDCPFLTYRLSCHFYAGLGVKQDFEKAVEWIRKAAEQGLDRGEYNLGFCYYYGKGVKKDYKEAVKWFRKAADKENAYAQVSLGECYYLGNGVKKDYTEAVKWFRKAADKENAYAQAWLGDCYYLGNDVKKDYTEAVKWFRKAADKENAYAQAWLGDCYYLGNGVKKDYTEAVKWFRKAADKENAYAQAWLGDCYYYKKGVEQNYSKAVEWFRKAADKENAYAQARLGECYYLGNGVEKDYTEAVKWFRKAADKENAMAQARLGNCYYLGKGVEKDYTEAVKLFRKAADKRNAYAQAYLGDCYYLGEGVEKDYTEAVELYRKAADKGNTYAQARLGDCYYLGEGVEKDYTEAVELYRKAADKGGAYAQARLGNCYYLGNGVEQNYSKAVEWFRKAADKENAYAQARLGDCYYFGNGVKKDYTEAVEWFRKAADKGNAMAQYMLGLCYEKGHGVEIDTNEAYRLYTLAEEQGVKAAAAAKKRLL